MKLWIDCEFNGYGGELLSMALVDQDGREWYEVLSLEGRSVVLDPWVAEHVMPKLGGRRRLKRDEMAASLASFLSHYATAHVVADWPDDIRYFCELLLTGPGTRIDTPPLTMEVLRIDAISQDPHNALADARALRLACAVIDAEAYRKSPPFTALDLWRVLCRAYIDGAVAAGASMCDRLLNERLNNAAEGRASEVLTSHGLDVSNGVLLAIAKDDDATVITHRVEAKHPQRHELSMFYTESAKQAADYEAIGWTVTALVARKGQRT